MPVGRKHFSSMLESLMATLSLLLLDYQLHPYTHWSPLKHQKFSYYYRLIHTVTGILWRFWAHNSLSDGVINNSLLSFLVMCGGSGVDIETVADLGKAPAPLSPPPPPTPTLILAKTRSHRRKKSRQGKQTKTTTHPLPNPFSSRSGSTTDKDHLALIRIPRIMCS